MQTKLLQACRRFSLLWLFLGCYALPAVRAKNIDALHLSSPDSLVVEPFHRLKVGTIDKGLPPFASEEAPLCLHSFHAENESRYFPHKVSCFVTFKSKDKATLYDFSQEFFLPPGESKSLMIAGNHLSALEQKVLEEIQSMEGVLLDIKIKTERYIQNDVLRLLLEAREGLLKLGFLLSPLGLYGLHYWLKVPMTALVALFLLGMTVMFWTAPSLCQNLFSLNIVEVFTLCTVLISVYAWLDKPLYKRFCGRVKNFHNQQELYRLLTLALLHNDTAHLFVNMLGLIMYGGGCFELFKKYALLGEFKRMKKKYPTLCFLGCYIGGILFSSAMDEFYPYKKFSFSIGASGGLYAVLGAFVMLLPKPLIVAALPTLVLLETIQGLLTTSNTAHVAHLAGFLYGIAFMAFINWEEVRDNLMAPWKSKTQNEEMSDE